MSKSQTFAHSPESVPLARQFARDAVEGAPPEVLETVALLVSEVATNCIRHTKGPFDLRITQGTEEIRIEATDRGGGEPRMRSPGPTDPTGRGLQIVDMLSTDWGYERQVEAGTTVWFTVAAA
jgi:serine/threonine-protein kinase RsbW